jgi:hypothetical protein
VLRRRLATQRLTIPGPVTAAEVVGLLGCVQSQEWAHGFWSLGLRTWSPERALNYADVQREFDTGDFLRTHILRPTWHYVTPEDIGWIQATTSARVHQRNEGMYRQTGLDPATRDRTAVVLLEALAGGTALTRPELGGLLADHGIEATGLRLAYILMSAELDGLVASGPLRGAQHTYRRLDELLVGRSVRRPEDPTAELLIRFLTGHGPATLADFTRWSSLTSADAQAAVERLADRVLAADVDGLTVWWAAGAPEPAPRGDQAWLIPLYDELTLSYPRINFSPADGHPHPPGEDLFRGSVIIDDRNVGLWKRTVSGRRVAVERELASSCSAADQRAARAAAERLANFLGRDLV